MKKFFKWASLSPSAWFGAFLLLVFFLMGIFGWAIAPHSPSHGDLDARLLSPSGTYLFGTDENGVDLFSAILHGAGIAALISTATVLICATIGVLLGTIAGYFRGVVDEVVMGAMNILTAFPGLLLNLAIVAVMKRPGIAIVIFALSINGWVGYARVARGQVLALREREFVTAARAVGAGPFRIMLLHVIPNLVSPLLVQMTFGFGGIILVEAALSFLGLGPSVPYSWGTLLDQGRGQLWTTQRLALVPGLAIALVVLGCNLLGDGLRDRLDPRRLRT
jgi:peptide/nickel transport system permease protein